MSMRIGVVGAGAFGRGVAAAAVRVGNQVTLVTRRTDLEGREGVDVTRDQGALRDADVVFVAVPSSKVVDTARSLADHLDGRHLLVHVSRGLVGDGLTTLTQILRVETPCRRVGALAGPLVADALADGRPGGGIVGTHFPEVAEAVRQAIAGPSLRIYDTDDVVGVEVASACVGLLSLATGYATGLGVGPSALAVLATMGMVEAAHLGETLGAHRHTFSGLAGIADLVSVVAGDRRPEFVLGKLVAQGKPLAEALPEVGANVESIDLARRLVRHAERHRVEVPICDVTARVLEGRTGPTEAIAELMARPVTRV